MSLKQRVAKAEFVLGLSEGQWTPEGFSEVRERYLATGELPEDRPGISKYVADTLAFCAAAILVSTGCELDVRNLDAYRLVDDTIQYRLSGVLPDDDPPGYAALVASKRAVW